MEVVKTKENIIRDIARQTNNNICDIKLIYNKLEDIIFDLLSSTNEEQDIVIKLFEGITLNGTYVSGKTKKNNLTGEINFVDSKIKPKFYITRSYCEKLNSQ